MVKEKKFIRWFNRIFGRTVESRIFHIINYTFFTFFALIMLYPFIYVLKTSFLQNKLINGIAVQEYGFSAYISVLKNEKLWRAFFNTVLVTVIGTCLSVMFTYITAYPLSRSHLRFKTPIMLYILFTTMFSGGLIPFYILMGKLGLRNSYFVYIVPGLIGGFNIIIMKNFISGLPSELEEAAKIDGANNIIIMLGIYFPLSGPILATIALWVAVGRWNNYMTGLLYIDSSSKLLIQNILRNMIVSANNATGGADPDIMNMAEGVKMASIVVGILPIIMIYPFVAKHFTKGVLIGSVKG